MAIVVSTTDIKHVKATLTIQGVAMDETSARKTANNLRGWLRYELGVSREDDDIEVTLEADATPLPEEPEEGSEPMDPESPALASAAEIAAMTPTEYRAAKAAGRIGV